MPSVLGHCWLGVENSIWNAKSQSDKVLALLPVCSDVQMAFI